MSRRSDRLTSALLSLPLSLGRRAEAGNIRDNPEVFFPHRAPCAEGVMGQLGVPVDADVERGYAAARAVMRHHAHTFYFAARLLRPARRRATFALYALFRTLDDLVDEVADGARHHEAARAELEGWRAWLRDPEAHPRAEPMLPAVRDTIARFGIETRHFLDLIDGLEMDLDRRRYPDFAALAGYCYRVAATVGLAMCPVLEASAPEAYCWAAELGVAMQITNILRDVREDFANGRVYLPVEMLAAVGWSEADLARGRVDDGFRKLARGLVARARIYYARGVHGLRYLSPDARFAILVAARCYAGILDQIEAVDYDVFSRRAHVSGPAKLHIALRSTLSWREHDADALLPPLPADAPDGNALITAITSGRGATWRH